MATMYLADQKVTVARNQQAQINRSVDQILKTYNQYYNTAGEAYKQYSGQINAGYGALDQLSELLGISKPKGGYQAYTENAMKRQLSRMGKGNIDYATTPMTEGQARNFSTQVNFDLNTDPNFFDNEQMEQPSIGSALQRLQQTPGYQFRKQQGEEAIGRVWGAKTGYGSGNMLQGLLDYNQNLAQESYDKQVGNLKDVAQQGLQAQTLAMTQ